MIKDLTLKDYEEVRKDLLSISNLSTELGTVLDELKKAISSGLQAKCAKFPFDKKQRMNLYNEAYQSYDRIVRVYNAFVSVSISFKRAVNRLESSTKQELDAKYLVETYHKLVAAYERTCESLEVKKPAYRVILTDQDVREIIDEHIRNAKQKLVQLKTYL